MMHSCWNGKRAALLSLAAAGCFLFFAAGGALAMDAAADQSRSPVSLEGVQLSAGGPPRFTLMADRADIGEVLKAIFAKMGADYAIDQDVEGPVDLRLRNETLPRILQAVEAIARPPVVVRMVNGVYRVSLRETQGVPGPRLPGRFAYQALTLGSRPVTLEVPEDHPITLEAALEKIGLQTGCLIRMDARIPRSLMFSGHIRQAPLGTVLQAIADTSGLKLVPAGSELLLVPQDRFLITLGGAAVGGYPADVCRFCGTRLLPGWKFCPHCGKPAPNPRPGRP